MSIGSALTHAIEALLGAGDETDAPTPASHSEATPAEEPAVFTRRDRTSDGRPRVTFGADPRARGAARSTARSAAGTTLLISRRALMDNPSKDGDGMRAVALASRDQGKTVVNVYIGREYRTRVVRSERAGGLIYVEVPNTAVLYDVVRRLHEGSGLKGLEARIAPVDAVVMSGVTDPNARGIIERIRSIQELTHDSGPRPLLIGSVTGYDGQADVTNISALAHSAITPVQRQNVDVGSILHLDGVIGPPTPWLLRHLAHVLHEVTSHGNHHPYRILPTNPDGSKVFPSSVDEAIALLSGRVAQVEAPSYALLQQVESRTPPHMADMAPEDRKAIHELARVLASKFGLDRTSERGHVGERTLQAEAGLPLASQQDGHGPAQSDFGLFA